jgi:metallo-beta-lactamase family protein
MKIKFLGASGQVTGSKFYLTEQKILIDCGLEQENKFTMYDFATDINAKDIKAIILTHAHIDHSGFIPRLIHLGFRGPLYMTTETAKLVPLLWKDNYKIYAKEKKKNDVFLITDEDTNLAIKRIKPKEFHQNFKIDDLLFNFFPAGHILGAASLLCEFNQKKLIFSGDLGRFDDPLHLAPSIPDEADYLLMESTYGASQIHSQTTFEEFQDLFRLIQEKSFVHIFFATFALGRLPQVLIQLQQFFKKYPQYKLPIWIDSPLGIEFLRIYQKNKTLKFNEDTWPLKNIDYKLVEHKKQREKLLRSQEKIIILTSSGMMEGGPIQFYLQNKIDDPKSIFISTGFSAKNTLASHLKNNFESIMIEQKSYHVKAHIYECKSFSSHAHLEDIKMWTRNLKPKKLILIHGEDEKRLSLKNELLNFASSIYLPHINDEIVLD